MLSHNSSISFKKNLLKFHFNHTTQKIAQGTHHLRVCTLAFKPKPKINGFNIKHMKRIRYCPIAHPTPRKEPSTTRTRQTMQQPTVTTCCRPCIQDTVTVTIWSSFQDHFYECKLYKIAHLQVSRHQSMCLLKQVILYN